MAETDADFRPDRTLSLNWGTLSYSESGGGAPILLLHGNGRDRRDWVPVLHDLHGRRLIRPDFRGHGGSSVPEDRFTVQDLMGDLLELADELWLGKMDLVGHSLGGMVALRLLQTHPERVGRVALIEGWTRLTAGAALGDTGVETLADETARAIRRRYQETFRRWMPGIREHYWESLEALDASDCLRRTEHEILEIYGDRGKPPPPLEALAIPRRDNIRVAWIKNGSHFPLMGRPAETGALLRDFLIGTENDGPADTRPPPDLDGLMMRPRQ